MYYVNYRSWKNVEKPRRASPLTDKLQFYKGLGVP